MMRILKVPIQQLNCSIMDLHLHLHLHLDMGLHLRLLLMQKTEASSSVDPVFGAEVQYNMCIVTL